jgi:hypothetical protein
MLAGEIILVFGLFSLGRGLLDVFRSEAVARSNRGLNERIKSGRSGAMPGQRRHAEDPAEVRRQGKNVLWFSAATLVTGVVVMALSSSV